jgi:hypothetical protein
MALEKSPLDTANDTTRYKISELSSWFADHHFRDTKRTRLNWFDFKTDIYFAWNIGFAQYPFIRIAFTYIGKELTLPIAFGEPVPLVIPTAWGPLTTAEIQKDLDVDLNSTQVWGVWQRRFYFSLLALMDDRKYTRAEFRDWLRAFGVYVYKELPDSKTTKEFKKWASDYDKWLEKTLGIQKILNFTQTIVLFVVGVTIPTPEGALEDIQDKLKDAAKDVLSVDNLTGLGTQIIIDTLNDSLNEQRKEILRALEAVDDNTSLNLDSLLSEVSGITRDAIEGINGIVSTIIAGLVSDIQGRITGVDKALDDTTSDERAAMEEIQASGGLGFAVGLKRLLWQKKKE